MRFLCKLFRQNPDSREGVISATSGLGIAVNVVLALVKVIIGLMTSSIAIISEGANVASDSLSSLLTLIGTKLASRHPDSKHPFGYGRIEYLASLIISVMILVTGLEMLISSVKLIFHPEEMNISALIIVLVALTAAVKFFLGVYTMKVGKKVSSGALVGMGMDSRNDAFASLITIVASLVYLIFHVSLDAYAGIIISALILKSGIGLLMDTVSDLLGRPGEHELAVNLYREIRGTEGILSAADMMLHNYGPDAWSGSVNVEIDSSKTVGEIYSFLHALQLRIMHEYHVTMVFGVYAVDRTSPESKLLGRQIGAFVKDHAPIKSFHAVYLDEANKTLYFDIIVDYSLHDWQPLRDELTAYMHDLYPDYNLQLTIETEFV